MATKGYLSALLARLTPEVRVPVQAAFDHTLDTFRLGDAPKALNFAWQKFESTTHTTANTEFSILHGLGQTPTKAIPVIDFGTVGSQLVPLVVSRAPDTQRVYLTSSSTGAVFTVYLEV